MSISTPTLFVVATPIGNLKDVTMRALEVLTLVDIIFCEDTRVTKKLLSHYEISTPTMSYHAHSGKRGLSQVTHALQSRKNCALVTDAGTPAISDPGAQLIKHVRSALKEAVSIVPIPGPDAVSTLISVAGTNTQPYTFYGFLPAKKGRQKLIAEVISSPYTAICYESTHRILKFLKELEAHQYAGAITIGRELTKFYEEILTGTPRELITILTDTPEKQKGEFVVLLSKLK